MNIDARALGRGAQRRPCPFRRGLDAAAAAPSATIGARMAALARAAPFVAGTGPADAPAVLVMRSLRHAHVQREADGTTRLKIPEGHFSTRFFLHPPATRTVFANVFGDNLHQLPPDMSVAVNTVSCPDLHEADLAGLSRVLAAHPELPVINRPEAVSGTGRADMAARLHGIPGLYVPRTLRLALPPHPTRGAWVEAVSALGTPVILRAVGTHTGRTAALVRHPRDIAKAAARFGPGAAIYATAFVDARGGAKLFTKYRAFFIDGRFHPVARLVANRWNVHSGDRYRVMFAMPEAQALERAYLSDPERLLGARALRALHEVQRTVGLDFFGLDFAQMPSGEVLVFEVNAVMRHNYDHAKTFPYTRPNLDRISAAFDAMVLGRAASTPGLKTKKTTSTLRCPGAN